MKRGLLLLNLGTPDEPTSEKVRVYLREFLMDPYVVDIPYPFRWLLVHGAVLPRRPKASAAAYRQIWSERGSPLLEHLDALVARVRELAQASRWHVEGGMRYGNPSIGRALESFRERRIDDVVVLPLYPQYSLAATESSVRFTREAAARVAPGMRLSFVPAFYGDAGFIQAFARIAREALSGFAYDHLLFSFHGLPERQVRKTDRALAAGGPAHCLASPGCCDRIVEANRDCYRAQCYATARSLAQELGLSPDRYTVCFQSRLGRTPWIRPYTDAMYAELASRGVRRVAVMCPAFVADCLETLEEVRIRGRADFRRLGGEELRLVPSLNSSPEWAQAVLALAERAAQAAAGDRRVDGGVA
jgi:ferrochelatase